MNDLTRDLERSAQRALAAALLLHATIAVRRAIDEECDPVTGTILSTDPEFERKCRRFDQLHAKEKAAWEALRPLL